MMVLIAENLVSQGCHPTYLYVNAHIDSTIESVNLNYLYISYTWLTLSQKAEQRVKQPGKMK